jgi:hypothetical protein
MKKTKKMKDNELVLAELGDKLIQEKIILERELKVIDKRVGLLDKKVKNDKWRNEKEKMDGHFFKFLNQKRGYEIMKRLEEIDKELKDDKQNSK